MKLIRCTIQLIFILLVSTNTQAQEDDFYKGVYYNFNPLCVLNIWNGPNINLSREHFLKTKKIFSHQTTIGVHFPVPLEDWKNLYGGFIKEEFRIYSDVSGLFLGLELAGGYQSMSKTDSIEIADIPNVSYHSERTWCELALNIGGKGQLNNWLTMETFLSVGGRYYNNNLNISDEVAEARHFGDWTVPRHYREYKGLNLAPKCTMTIRFGLKRKKQNKN